MNIPIQCQACGATGEVLRVTANLQCRCGSTDLDLWDGEKTAAFTDYGEQGQQHARDGKEPQRPHNSDYMRGYNFEKGQQRKNESSKEAAQGGSGWYQERPDPDTNWSDYAGPTPGHNPRGVEDADANHVCPVCNGTGHDERASGGGYDETTCRNCHGTGKVTYASDSHGPTNDAHVPSGPSLGASDNTKTSKVYSGGGAFASGGGGASYMHVTPPIRVALPNGSGNDLVKVSTGNKIMAMAAKIVETNSGLSTQEAFELARRAVAAFPEDGEL